MTENESCVMKLSLTVAMNLNQRTRIGPEQTGATRGEPDHLRGLGQLDQATRHVGHVSRAPIGLWHVSRAPIGLWHGTSASIDQWHGGPVALYHHDGGRSDGLDWEWDILDSLTGSWLESLERLTSSCDYPGHWHGPDVPVGGGQRR